jgi:hypothetical protein
MIRKDNIARTLKTYIRQKALPRCDEQVFVYISKLDAIEMHGVNHEEWKDAFGCTEEEARQLVAYFADDAVKVVETNAEISQRFGAQLIVDDHAQETAFEVWRLGKSGELECDQ